MMPNSNSLILFAGLSKRKYVMKRLFVSMSLLFLSTEALSAQGTSSEREDDGKIAAKVKAERLESMRQIAGEYRLSLQSEGKHRLTLHPKPLLRWSNPIRFANDGAVFLWTDKGEPRAIACIYTHRRSGKPGIDHEFQSLSLQPLTAEHSGRAVWTPPKSAVEFKTISDAPAPAKSAALRLSQMRSIARRFTVTIEKTRRKGRLLTQPIYRYGGKKPELLDGALFAFVQGTDPEVILLLEARSIDSKHVWQYALARMTSVTIEARYRDKIVWTKPPWDWKSDPKGPYITFVKKQSLDQDTRP